MKKLTIISLGTLAVMCACNSKPSNEFTINGTTDLADGEIVRLYYSASDTLYGDSAVVANGAFTFTGTVDRPFSGAVYYGGNMQLTPDNARQIIVEPGTMTIAFNNGSYNKAEVTGSPLTLQMDSLNDIRSPIYEEMSALQKKYAEAKDDTAAIADIEKKFEELSTKLSDAQINFVKSHPASYCSPMVMAHLKSNLSLEEIKEIYNSWTPEIQAADEETAKYIAALESIQPGAKAPEISGKDQNDKDVKLSDFKGKVVLVDFWATWCGPCRASLPHVKEIYEKYNGKGLEVLCISLDRETEPWKEYIANSGMGMEKYAHIYDQPVNNADNYGIQYIPSKFIVDAEGNMVGRFDDEEELDAKLAEIFK